MPDTSIASAQQRPVFSFRITGMSVREELLLRSMIRVLDRSTDHEWRCMESKPHLAIIQPPSNTDGFHPAIEAGTIATITVGHAVANPDMKLSLPLHPTELERALNKAGAIISRKLLNQEAIPFSVSSKLPLLVASQDKKERAAVQQLNHDPKEALQLARWPPAMLLSSLQHVKAATLLLKAPISMEKMLTHSGLTEDQALRFIAQLRQQNLLQQAQIAPELKAATPAAEVQSRLGLIARIRIKLGFQR